jgi:mediator of RNA polymerase II transcription subunit 7
MLVLAIIILFSLRNNFTNDDTIIRPLESQQIRRLYPQHFDRKKELKKLNHSLLVNFLDLIDILIYSPESLRRTEKIDDLTLLFVHLHHLLNEYRPHQARETLRVILELQKRQRKEVIARLNYHLEKVRDIVNNAFGNLYVPADEPLPETDLGPSESSASTDLDSVEAADRLMCEIVDEIPF